MTPQQQYTPPVSTFNRELDETGGCPNNLNMDGHQKRVILTTLAALLGGCENGTDPMGGPDDENPTVNANANGNQDSSPNVTFELSLTCPESVIAGIPARFEVQAAGARNGVTYLWELTEGEGLFDDPSIAAPSLTIANPQEISVLVTVSDDSGSSAVGACSIPANTDTQLVIIADTLLSGRADENGFQSGDLLAESPGSDGFSNSLAGSARIFDQTTISSDRLLPTWSLRFAPDGAGEVVITSPNEFFSTYRIAPPALAGTYQFRLTVVDTLTGAKDFASTTLLLVGPSKQYSVDGGITQRIFVDDLEQPLYVRVAAIINDPKGNPDESDVSWSLITWPKGADIAGIVIDAPDSAVTGVRFPGPVVFGGYLFEVTATNPDGMQASAVVNVRLEPSTF